MPTNMKHVFYVRNLPNHDVYTGTLAARPDVRLDRLETDSPDAIAGPVIRAAHVYQVGASRDEFPVHLHVNAALLARAPNLLVVSSSGAGFDPVDVEACTRAGVIVVNQSGGNARSVAEHVIAMLLALSKRIVETDRALRRGSLTSRNAFLGTEAMGKTIGIVGLGNVGRAVAQLAGGLLGLRVLAHDPYVDAAEARVRGAEKVSLDTLLSAADYVSINCPLNAETRGMIGAREFALMRPTAFFITTARGFIHDEAALTEALRAGKIAGAGVDVWTTEPPPADHPLLQFDTVIASPHTAGVTAEARANMARIAAEQVLAALDGKRPPRLINPEAWPRYAERFAKAFGKAPDRVG